MRNAEDYWYANYEVSNGTHNAKSFLYHTKKEAMKSIEDIGLGNTPIGCTCRIQIGSFNHPRFSDGIKASKIIRR